MPEDAVKISISDSGMGIADNSMPLLFKDFSQVDRVKVKARCLLFHLKLPEAEKPPFV